MSRIITKNNMLRYPLSGLQMQRLNPKSKIIIYDELNKINDINELFKDTDEIIILYLITSKFSGHWCTLFKTNKIHKNKPIFSFFDASGYVVDRQLDFLTPEQRQDLDEKHKRLDMLLKPYEVIYNNVKYQNKNTEVCGDHVTYRLHNKNLTDQQYYDKFIKMGVKDPDYFVADYILNLIRKNNIPQI